MAQKNVLSKTDFLAWLEAVGACSPALDWVRQQEDQDAEGIFKAAKKLSSFAQTEWLHWLGHALPENMCVNEDTLTWAKVLEGLGVA